MPLPINTFNFNKKELLVKIKNLRQNMPLTLLEWEKKYDELQDLSKSIPLVDITTYIELRSKLLAVAENFITSKDVVDAGAQVTKLQKDFDEWQDVYFEYMKIITLYAVFLLEQRAIIKLEQLFTFYETKPDFIDILTFYIQKKLIESDNIDAIKQLNEVINNFKSKHHHSVVIPTLAMNDYLTGNSLLHIAAQNNNSVAILLLLPLVDNINEVNNKLETALICAAKKGNLTAVQTLLKANANIKIKDKEGYTALHYVCQNAPKSIVSKLLFVNSSLINETTATSRTPLMLAIESNNLEVVAYLLELGVDVSISTKREGYNALHLACQRRQTAVVAKLVAVNSSLINETTATDLTPLMLAVNNNNLEVVNLLIDLGADITIKNANSYTALHLAARNASKAVVAKLLAVNSSLINERTDIDWTPLMLAVNNNNLEVVNLLIDLGADITIKDEEGYTALHYACQNGQIAVVAKLLAVNSSLINERTAIDWTPLMLAIEFETANLVKLVDLLLASGANITIKNERGYTALHYACQNGQIAVVAKLLAVNSSLINETTVTDLTPLMLAITKNNLELVDLLLEFDADITFNVLYFACIGGQIAIIEKLLAVNSSFINERTATNETLLMTTIENDNLEVVEILLALGADSTVKNESGYNAFHLACIGGQIAIIEKLLAVNSSLINERTAIDWTPLMLAIKNHNFKVIDFLLSSGADITFDDLHLAYQKKQTAVVEKLRTLNPNLINERTVGDWTPLMLAVKDDNYKKVEFLLALGADITAANNNGDIVLHLACEIKQQQIFNLLLIYGADIDKLNNAGKSPLHIACAFENDKIVESLLKYEYINISSQDNDGNIPLHIAAFTGNVLILKMLLAKALTSEAKAQMLNTRNNNDLTPLAAAAWFQNEEALLFLQEINDKVSKKNEHLLFDSTIINDDVDQRATTSSTNNNGFSALF